MKVNLTQGSDCIDFAAQQAHCVLTFQIIGGTGRFKDASGVLTLTETVLPVVADASGNPVFFAATGGIAGTVSGVTREGGPSRGAAIRTLSLACCVPGYNHRRGAAVARLGPGAIRTGDSHRRVRRPSVLILKCW